MKNMADNNMDGNLTIEEIMEIKEKIENHLQTFWDKFVLEIFKSAGWIVGGALASYITHIISNGMITIVFYGAVLYGIIRLFKVLSLIDEIKADINLKRKMLWASMGCLDFEKYY